MQVVLYNGHKMAVVAVIDVVVVIMIMNVNTDSTCNVVKGSVRSCDSRAAATPDVCGQDHQSIVQLTDTTDTGTQLPATPRCIPYTTSVSHTLQPDDNHALNYF